MQMSAMCKHMMIIINPLISVLLKYFTHILVHKFTTAKTQKFVLQTTVEQCIVHPLECMCVTVLGMQGLFITVCVKQQAEREGRAESRDQRSERRKEEKNVMDG